MTDTPLAQTLARAQHAAVERGYIRGGRRDPRPPTPALCKPEHQHARWAPADNLTLIRCGICHPPAPGFDVVWIEQWAA